MKGPRSVPGGSEIQRSTGDNGKKRECFSTLIRVVPPDSGPFREG